MAVTRWKPEEAEYLRKNYGRISTADIAKNIGRSEEAIASYAKRNKIVNAHHWTDDDRNYLRENYGNLSIDQLSKKLNRTYFAVRFQIEKMGLEVAYESGDGLTASEIGRMVGKDRNSIRECWMLEHGMKNRKYGKYRLTKMDDLIKWMQENPDRWDATKCEKCWFETYPWFREKLLADRQKAYEKRWGEVNG